MGSRELIVLDTHVWLWWAGRLPGLSRRATAALEHAERIGICTISVWELATLVRKGRIELDRDVRAWVAHALSAARVESIPLDVGVAIAAGRLGDDFPGDPADRIIYATAVARGESLVTKDRRLRRFDPDRTLW